MTEAAVSISNSDSIIANSISSRAQPPSESGNAVYIRNLYKSYGTGKDRSVILRSLDMTVKRGTIYGLLGPSGCGKTTLLSCVVGRRSFDSGDLLVLDTKPGAPSSGIPGRRVGFMPQEIALYQDFTIREIFKYFGSLFNLDSQFVKEQTDFLCDLLDLPPKERIVKTLSGGQQRRVSFAAALFHQPELLILDEPTAGVDPVLRTSIWNYLTHLSRDKGTTVIITTHYIEEALGADTVSMMRSGRLLAEDSPQNLLAVHEMTTLEDVFLKLCIKDVEESSIEESKGTSYHAIKDDENSPKNHNSTPKSLEIKKKDKKYCNVRIPSARRTRSLVHKNFLQLFRNIGMLLFSVTIPATQIVFFFLCIGRDVTSLKMGVVNEELTRSPNGACNYTMQCNGTSMFSCNFLRSLDEEAFIQVKYDKYSEALEAVKRGNIWGVIHFESNFSEKLLARIDEGDHAENETLLGSHIEMRIDSSNHLISQTIHAATFLAYEELNANILEACSYDRNAASKPIKFQDNIYGGKRLSMTHFLAPGMILAMVYFFSLLLTSTLFIIEKQSGLVDRNLVSGVQVPEILVAHLITQSVVMTFQMTFVYIITIFVFGIKCEGSFITAISLTILQGFCGMTHGILVSVFCENMMEAFVMAAGYVLPNIFLSGMLWPSEAMFFVMRYGSYLLPQTLAVASMRNIFARGWGIEKFEVSAGFLASFSWIAIYLTIAIVYSRLRNQ